MTVLALLCAAACSSGPRDPRASQSTTPIELAENTTVFTLTTTLTAQRSPAARQREAAALATGALYIPLVDGSGNPALAAGGTATRGTCGVTFVSPSYAITAAHCVDGTTSDLSSLTVQMFRPTPALDAGFLDAASLSGTFPAYEHAQLGAGDGYFVDRYACALVSRCSDQYGGPLACDAAVAAGADTALLHCDGTPGHKYGFLAVANQDDPAAALFMPWKHEVYDVPVAGADTADDRWQHYVVLSGESTNYHYLGQDTSGVEQNQLLPLVSADFPDGTAHHELAASAPFVTTDLWGCHGTSGSGVLQQTPNGLWALLGPAALGNNELTTYLCNHIPSLDGMCRGPGCVGITYVGLATTQGITSGNADNQTALANDCESFAETETSIYTHLPCLVQGTSENTQNGAWAAHLASPTAVSPLDPLRGPVIALAAGESVGLTEFEVAEGTHYRIGLTAWSSTGCPSAPCPTLALNSAAFAVPPSTLTRAFEAPAPLPQPTPMAATYLAQVGGPLVLTPGAVNGAFEVDGLTVRPEAAVNDFDAMPERLEASLVDLEAAPQAQPMRFVGDGKAGFAARLLADERMVLGRQALAPGHRWTAKFAASPASTPADAATAPPALTCGLLDPAGQVVLQADCSSGFVQLDDTAGADARAAFFVQTAVAGEPASIDDLQLVSDAMPDTDGDGIPDAVDPCPTGPQPAGQTLDVTLPATAAFSVCAPEPSNLALPVPQVQNACDPPVLAGRLVSVNGAPLGSLVVAVPADGHVLLPLGASTISWEVRDPAGHVYAALSSTATVTAITGAAQSACCAVTQTVVSGTAGNDALGPENGLASCFLADTGDDFVASGAGGSWISGESGADFLAGGGGDDVILGGDGDDVISGGSGGRLTVYAGAGSDTVEARFAASARIFGGSGADVLVGSDGPDQIFPGAGAVLVVAGGGDDTVTIYDACELAAGLHLSGGAGQDTLITPLSLDDLDRRGVGVDGFESVVVDTAHGYLSPCFGGP